MERSALHKGHEGMGGLIAGAAEVERPVLPQSGGRTVGSAPERGYNGRFRPRAGVERSVLPQGQKEIGRFIAGAAVVERFVLPQSGGRTVTSATERGWDGRFDPRARVERLLLPQGHEGMGRLVAGAAGVERPALPQSGGITLGAAPERE